MKRRAGSGWDRATGAVRSARNRWPWLEHLVRAYGRYSERHGDRLAAAMTYFGFLSFFPLLALGYSLLGYVVGVSEPARVYLVDAMGSLLPGQVSLPVEQIARAKTTAGIIGLVGLLYTGLGWVNALRESLRDIWGNDPSGGGHFLVKRLWDVGTLVFLGTVLMASVAVSTLTTHAGRTVLDWLGLGGLVGMGVLLRLATLAVAIGCNMLIFLVLFSRMTGTRAPWRRIVRGALFGAVGLEILKMIGTFLITLTTHNPVYASFAVVAGMLVWIDVVSRFMLFTAAWTATRRVVLSADAEHLDDPDRPPVVAAG
ncbi:YihY/virulence factor BrkB family protein [Actinomadura craniellae]|uniref:YihY/virulence factor BrkB family protein n=1 Tax=Actinomadura craniellae TaxID=2231787 RepID=A0A365H8V6_9ACTN|nr:YihY/virulence factor BrkB family protein [Actinomadura craniellae]